MHDTRRIFSVSSDVVGAHCPICKVAISEIGGDSIDTLTNHLIQQHDWYLLHVGQETTRDMDGRPWHRTVAVLGEPE